jgi:hypothetical protein
MTPTFVLDQHEAAVAAAPLVGKHLLRSNGIYPHISVALHD